VASRVVLVGVGRISPAHLRALEGVEAVEDVVGVDPNPRAAASFRQAPLPIEQDLRRALSAGSDLVVVATPTASHAAVVAAVRACDARVPILLEKPAASRRRDADEVLADAALEVILHSGFASQVIWATEFYGSQKSRFGELVAFEAWFGNPYAPDREERAASLGNSWLDSGINALSVIGRFAIPATAESFRALDADASTFEARLSLGEPGEGHKGTIFTTWQAAGHSYWTRLRFAGGGELVLDDIAGAATVYENGVVTESFTRSHGGDRLERHYASFYGDYFGPRRWQYPAGADRALHGLLFSALELLATRC